MWGSVKPLPVRLTWWGHMLILRLRHYGGRLSTETGENLISCKSAVWIPIIVSNIRCFSRCALKELGYTFVFFFFVFFFFFLFIYLFISIYFYFEFYLFIYLFIYLLVYLLLVRIDLALNKYSVRLRKLIPGVGLRTGKCKFYMYITVKQLIYRISKWLSQ